MNAHDHLVDRYGGRATGGDLSAWPGVPALAMSLNEEAA